jgi:hypothetical protein
VLQSEGGKMRVEKAFFKKLGLVFERDEQGYICIYSARDEVKSAKPYDAENEIRQILEILQSKED